MDDSSLKRKRPADLLNEVTTERVADEGVSAEEVDCTRRPRIEEHSQSENSNGCSSVSDFAAIMKYYMTELQYLGPAVLVCVICDELPDDPYVAQCGHIFCEECHSGILYERAGENHTDETFVACTVPMCGGGIADALALDPGQWGALAEIQGLPNNQRSKWRGQVGAMAVAKISQNSGLDDAPSLGDLPNAPLDNNQEAISEDDSSRRELSDDGYSDSDDRSVDYANDSGIDDRDLSEESEGDRMSDTSSVGARSVTEQEVADLLEIH